MKDVGQSKELMARSSRSLLLAVTCVAACHWGPTETVLDSDMCANYTRIFGQQVPSDVDVLRSVIIDYSTRVPGFSPTDDWCFELLAPMAWIDQQIAEQGLSPTKAEKLWLAPTRGGGLPDWYAPHPLDGYEAFELTLTSVPYIHMLVSPRSSGEGRHRVFIGKW